MLINFNELRLTHIVNSAIFHENSLMTMVINPQTTVRGPCGPRNFSIKASKVNIGITDPMFHLILHNTEPLSCIN